MRVSRMVSVIFLPVVTRSKNQMRFLQSATPSVWISDNMMSLSPDCSMKLFLRVDLEYMRREIRIRTQIWYTSYYHDLWLVFPLGFYAYL